MVYFKAGPHRLSNRKCKLLNDAAKCITFKIYIERIFKIYCKKEWAARLLIERSKAIKAPKIQYQLMCTKKFQQFLAEDGVLETIFKEKKIVDSIRATFFNQYSFGTVKH